MSKPTNVELTDQEVLRRLQRIGDALAEEQGRISHPVSGPRPSPPDWRRQVQLLDSACQLLADDISHRSSFVGWMSLYLRHSVAHLLRSPRATVALAAIEVLRTLVDRCGNRSGLACVCSWFVPCLTRLAASPCVASSVATATRCVLQSFAQNCLFTSEGLNNIMKDCGAASAAVRRCSMQTLRIYLQTVKGTSHQLSVRVYTEALHRLIRSGTLDADAHVRREARRCFWALHLLEPGSSGALLGLLSPVVQEQLRVERNEAMVELCAVQLPDAPRLKSPAAAAVSNAQNSTQIDAQRLRAALLSCTSTLKDDLQTAVANRARAASVHSTSSPRRHRQLLRSSEDAALQGEVGSCASKPSLTTHGRATYTRGLVRQNGTPLHELMESSDWSVRRSALLQARQLCERNALGGEDIVAMLEAIGARLHDAHVRVVEAAQGCLSSLLSRIPASEQVEFQRLLPLLMGALCDHLNHTQPTVRDGAHEVLERIARLCDPPAVVLEAVLRAADDAKGHMAGQRCAEYAHYVITVHRAMLSDVSCMNKVLRCALAHLRTVEGSSSSETHRTAAYRMRKSWTSVIAAAYIASPSTFQEALKRCEGQQKAQTMEALHDCFPSSSWVEAVAERNYHLEMPPRTMVQPRSVFADELALQSRSKTSRVAAPASKEAMIGSTAAEERPSETEEPPDDEVLDLQIVKERRQDKASSQQEHKSSFENKWSALPLPGRRLSSRTTTTSSSIPFRDRNAALENETDVVVHDTPCEPHSRRMGESQNPVAQFFHDWSQSNGCISRRETLAALTEALEANRPTWTGFTAPTTRRALVDASVIATDSAPEDVSRLLACWERELHGIEKPSHHSVRCAVYAALEALLCWPAARSSVARQLVRIISVCRVGLDDAFLEVQVRAATCLSILFDKIALPADLCLSALASCLLRWQEGATRDAATPGWVNLVHLIHHIVERTPRTVPVVKRARTRIAAEGFDNERTSVPTLTAPVLQRVVAALQRCLGHCHPAMRLSAVLVLVALRRGLGEAVAQPFLESLSPVHLRLISFYTDKSEREEHDQCWKAEKICF